MSQNTHSLNNLEIAHILSMDVVEFSTHLTYEQPQLMGRLKEVVSNTSVYRRYEDSPQLIRRSTGDELVLVFFGDAEAHARCALEICRALKSHPEIKLRMGIHTGPVMRTVGFEGKEDATGKGMNIVQRVMSCGEAGHILVSSEAAADLMELPKWKERLHDLGEAVVKHGERIHLFNLYDEECGNSSVPPKLRGQGRDDGGGSEPAVKGPLEGVNHAIAPYAGPQPFTPTMADKFFGRQRETKELLKLLSESRIVVLFAASGAGKSSLLNTHIRQRLAHQRYEVLIDARVGGTLPEEIDISEIRNIFTYSAIYSLSQKARPAPECRLSDYLRTRSPEPGSQGRVLILDQFEELFTQYPNRHEDRAGFFEDLIAAMNDDRTLRVILAMRKEYLSDIEQLAEQLAKEADVPLMRRFRLNCMERAQALEAITAPIASYAVFTKGVAEKIVDQLNTIRVPGRDGKTVSKRGEFIEMVHLQIVCERLWRSLPEGVTQIKMEHLERAAGEGKKFNEFVVNAMDLFYDSTVKEVVRSSETRNHGGYSPELLRLGCIKFVTPALTRTMVRHTNGRVGRLPYWIVDQLENSHLLRSEQRGGELWYELAHDRLAEPVGRWMDPKVNSLLHTADLLEKVLGKALEENNRNLNGYFAKHHDLLAQCQPFRHRAGLFEDEAEFVFRASLVDGELKQMYRWSRRLSKDYPEVRLKVLSDALTAGPPEVRRHTAELLGLKRDQDVADDLAAMLARLAQSDDDSSVRRAAAVTLAQLDRRKVYDDLIGGLHNPTTRAGAEAALSQIRVAADQRVKATIFEERFGRLGWGYRWRIRWQAWAQRLKDESAVLPFIVVPAALFATILAAVFKSLPGRYGWALTQGTPNAGMGAFQGATAGFIWAGFILLGLTIYNVAFRREYVQKYYVGPFAAIVTGAVCGFVSSMMINLVVIAVFELSSLVGIGWILPRKEFPPDFLYSRDFWSELFFQTRFGWVYLITGTGLGVGIALTTNRLLASGQWRAFLKKQRQLAGFKQMAVLLYGIIRILLRHAWPLPIMLLVTGLLAYFVPEVPSKCTAGNIRSCKSGVATGLIGDCVIQVLGAFFGIVGMGFGIVSVTWGVRLEPRATWGLHLKRRNK